MVETKASTSVSLIISTQYGDDKCLLKEYLVFLLIFHGIHHCNINFEYLF